MKDFLFNLSICLYIITLVSGDSLEKKGPPLSPWQESFPPSGRPAQIMESATAYLKQCFQFGTEISFYLFSNILPGRSVRSVAVLVTYNGHLNLWKII